MIMLLHALLAALLLALGACGGGGGDAGTAAPRPSPVPDEVSSGTTVRSLEVGGRIRTYRVHVPPGVVRGVPVPAVYVLHGRLGTGANAQSTYGFDAFAEARGFMTIYPDGFSNSWNDGWPGSPAAEAGIDDLAFFDAMDADLRGWIALDDRRIFACGMSNGAFMTHRLAIERPERFAAVGTVCGHLTESVAAIPDPPTPVSCVLVSGTSDPIVPWEGGERAAGAEATFERYRRRNGTGATVAAALADLDPEDGATATLLASDGGIGGTSVHLYRIDGGGHTWPGRPGTVVIGANCRDLDATAVLVDFLLSHPRPGPAG